jgi:tetrahydromethanopterin S-methyltransferase subunit B
MAEKDTISLQIQMIENKIKRLERTKEYYLHILEDKKEQEEVLKEWKELESL